MKLKKLQSIAKQLNINIYSWDDGKEKSIYELNEEIKRYKRGYVYKGEWYPCSDDRLYPM